MKCHVCLGCVGIVIGMGATSRTSPAGVEAEAPRIPPEITTMRPATGTAFRLRSFARVAGPEQGGAMINPGRPGAFDSAWLGTPDVQFDGKLYRMWYSGSVKLAGYGGEAVHIALLTSADGIHWQRANGGKPVFDPGPPGSFDEAQVMGPSVLYDGKTWRMWYCGLRPPEKPGVWEIRLRIGLATSKDGIHWDRQNQGRPVLDLGAEGSTDSTQVMHPSVLREGSGYRMWYAANSKRLPHTIAMATSRDGIHWTKYRGGAPVQGLGHYVTGPSVYHRGNEYLMLYSREDLEANYWFVAAAVSSDGFRWKVLNHGKPVVENVGPQSPGGRSRAEEGSAFHPSPPLPDGASLRFWYVENPKPGPGGYRIALGKLTLDWPKR